MADSRQKRRRASRRGSWTERRGHGRTANTRPSCERQVSRARITTDLCRLRKETSIAPVLIETFPRPLTFEFEKKSEPTIHTQQSDQPSVKNQTHPREKQLSDNSFDWPCNKQRNLITESKYDTGNRRFRPISERLRPVEREGNGTKTRDQSTANFQ